MKNLQDLKEIFFMIWSISAILNILILWNEEEFSSTVTVVVGVAAIFYIICICIEKAAPHFYNFLDWFYNTTGW